MLLNKKQTKQNLNSILSYEVNIVHWNFHELLKKYFSFYESILFLKFFKWIKKNYVLQPFYWYLFNFVTLKLPFKKE